MSPKRLKNGIKPSFFPVQISKIFDSEPRSFWRPQSAAPKPPASSVFRPYSYGPARIHGQKSHKMSKLACPVPRSKYNRKCVVVHRKKTPISLWGCKIEGRFDRGNSVDLDQNHTCLNSELVNSIPKGIQQVIGLKGHLTKY